jgi:Raf kinase inhibitor-like YbhB/YbcL family protein
MVLGIILGAGCSREIPAPVSQGELDMKLQVSSAAFVEGGMIPERYTCAGEDLSPPLAWSGVPTGAESLVLIADDPDAPGGTWVHWVIYAMAPSLNNLPEGLPTTERVAGIGTQGKNGFRKLGYGGPCPPPGKPHRYYFKLYALENLLNAPPGAGKADVEKAMKGHILAEGQLMGQFGR